MSEKGFECELLDKREFIYQPKTDNKSTKKSAEFLLLNMPANLILNCLLLQLGCFIFQELSRKNISSKKITLINIKLMSLPLYILPSKY